LHQGSKMFEGRWTELDDERKRFRLGIDDWERAVALGITIAVQPDIIELGPNDDVSDVVKRLVNAGVKVRAVEPLRPTLESLYLDLIREHKADT